MNKINTISKQTLTSFIIFVQNIQKGNNIITKCRPQLLACGAFSNNFLKGFSHRILKNRCSILWGDSQILSWETISNFVFSCDFKQARLKIKASNFFLCSKFFPYIFGSNCVLVLCCAFLKIYLKPHIAVLKNWCQ